MKSNRVIRSIPILSVLLLIGLGVVMVFALGEHTVNAAQIPLLDDSVLEEKAIAAAQAAGLQGPPTAKIAVHMTLAEWLTLNDAELGKDAAQFGLTPDMPVFVLAMRGNVNSLLLGESLRQEQNAPEKYNNITIVLDAKTGNVMWNVVIREGFPMPVSVP